MDIKTSVKETRYLPSGPAEVLADSVFDLYPVYDRDDPDLITDVEMLDDENAELLDRAVFAAVRQRGMDPLAPEEGVQWAEYLLGEAAAPVILLQVQDAVLAAGGGVKIAAETVKKDGRQYVMFRMTLA